MKDFLGMYDAWVGDPSFDKHFVVRTSNVLQMRNLLASEAVRTLIKAQPTHIRLQARDQDEECPSLLPAEVDQLHIRDKLFITDLEQLKGLFNLFRGMLQRLVEIGSIDAIDPNIEF